MAETCNADLITSAKRIFAIQEERIELYKKIKRTQEDYVGSDDPMQPSALREYQLSIASITGIFTSLAHEVDGLILVFNRHSRRCVCEMLEQIEVEEKQKLKYIVEYHIAQCKGEEEEEQTDDLKRKLSKCEDNISTLIEDMRYECEDLLLQ